MKKNKYIEKFKFKTKSELEYKIENPSLFDKEAIEAAKVLLENYSINENNTTKEKNIESIEKVEPIYKEKAFFKYKWMYRFAIFYTCIVSLACLWLLKYEEHINYAIWGIINIMAFIVLISKHRKTLYYLKVLSIVALIFIIYKYIYTYFNLNENETINFQSKDVNYILFFFVILFGGEQLIEVRKVQINK
ncbi:hypothetical protein [Wenyingzhuangia sp. IMCC45467]